MQRSFSSTATCRRVPIHLVALPRVSSTSSVDSSSSVGCGNHRILPVRYSSLDRILSKPPEITANQRGINVRINFARPRRRRKRREGEIHHHHPPTEQSNITYIETRSIVRDNSKERVTKTMRKYSKIEFCFFVFLGFLSETS